MIALVKQPGAIALSRNPMVIEFLATDANGQPYRAMGVRSELNAQHASDIVDGETLRIDYVEPDGSTGFVVFTARDQPNGPLEFVTKSTPGKTFTNLGYWEEVAETINAYPQINQHFKVYAIENDVVPNPDYSLWIEVVDIDSAWTLSFDISGISTHPFTVNNFDTALPTTAPDNYAILVDLFFEVVYNSGEVERIAQLELPINQAGKAWVDLSEIIGPAVQNSLPRVQLPDYSDNTPVVADNLRQYSFRYREDYDNVVPSWVSVTSRIAMAGGVTQDLFVAFDFLANLTATKALLTWYPSGKTVSPTQPEWISWYNFDGVDKSILLEVKTWTADSIDAITFYSYNTVDPVIGPSQVALLPVGPLQLAIETDVKKYSVRVIDYDDYAASSTVTYLSEARSYYVDRLSYQEIRYVMYENGFGLPETLRTIGEFNDQLNIERSERSHVLAPDYDALSPQVSQYKAAYLNQYTFRSGYLGRLEVAALQELLIYNRAFEIQSDSYVPLHLTDNRYQIFNTSKFLNGVQFVAIRSLKDKIYMRRDPVGGYVEIPPIPPPAVGVGNWQIGTGNIFTVS